MDDERRVINLSIFLMKETVDEFNRALKNPAILISTDIKQKYGIEGKIYYCDSNQTQPRWKAYLDELSEKKIELSDNSSNKAVIIVKVKERYMAISFGYGRSLIREEVIERNFGLKVALNVINQDKMRSVNAAVIEDMVVTTQRQASYRTTQEEFGLNTTSDIIRGITGKPYDDIYGNNISGKDVLTVAVPMELSELSEKLELFYDAYFSDRYKKIGFAWVDNVSEVRDPLLKDELDFELCKKMESKDLHHLHIAPPETTNWDMIEGFCFQGTGKKTDTPDNFVLNLDLKEYVDCIKQNTNLYSKLHRDKLLVLNSNQDIFPLCNIYAALICQIEHEGKTYILSGGAWYRVEPVFINYVNDFIQNIPKTNIVLPTCNIDESEGDYNERTANSSNMFCLMDKKLVSVKNGPKHVEACDIFTKNKQLIHIKNRGQSAQLSHLFSQGRVAAECFISDEEFRRQVYQQVSGKLGKDIFDYKDKPKLGEFEIVYVIIAQQGKNSIEQLPFFSKVNLMLTCQSLDRMRFKYSVGFVERI